MTLLPRASIVSFIVAHHSTYDLEGLLLSRFPIVKTRDSAIFGFPG